MLYRLVVMLAGKPDSPAFQASYAQDIPDISFLSLFVRLNGKNKRLVNIRKCQIRLKRQYNFNAPSGSRNIFVFFCFRKDESIANQQDAFQRKLYPA